MAPGAVPLQLLRARLFIHEQFIHMLRIGVMRDVYVHANVEQHH
jgi:hypothetical protein